MVGIIKAGLWWWITNELERIFNHYVFLLCLTSITDNSQIWKGYSIWFQLGVQMRSIWEYNLFSNIYTPHQTSETFSWTNCIKTPGYDLSYIGSAGKYQDLQSATEDKTNTEQIHSPLLPHNFEFMLWIGYYFKNISRRIILFSELSRFCASWQTTKHVRVKSSQWQKFPRR